MSVRVGGLVRVNLGDYCFCQLAGLIVFGDLLFLNSLVIRDISVPSVEVLLWELAPRYEPGTGGNGACGTGVFGTGAGGGVNCCGTAGGICC